MATGTSSERDGRDLRPERSGADQATGLTRQASRIERALEAMHNVAHTYEGHSPPALGRRIDDFGRELDRVEAELRDLRRKDLARRAGRYRA